MRWAIPLLASVSLTAAPTGRVVQSIDLTGPFATRSPWRVTVTQAPDEADPIMGDGNPVPGVLTLCLAHGANACDPQLGGTLRIGVPRDWFDTAHELRRLSVVRPRPDRPLLLLQLGSLQSVNGDQRIGTELYAYDRAADRFVALYRHQTRRNNNQEVRYVERGPLAGAVIVAEPTSNAPFGYWITVSRLGATAYRPVLRFRSATRYGDGNPLAVIDAEMPGIQRRLGLWRAGRPLPLPTGGCLHPLLRDGALWCEPR